MKVNSKVEGPSLTPDENKYLLAVPPFLTLRRRGLPSGVPRVYVVNIYVEGSISAPTVG